MSGATYIMGAIDRPMEHILRKPVESSRAYRQRRKTIVFGIVLTLVNLLLKWLVMPSRHGY